MQYSIEEIKFSLFDESAKQAYTDENFRTGESAVRLAFANIDCDRLHVSR